MVGTHACMNQLVASYYIHQSFLQKLMMLLETKKNYSLVQEDIAKISANINFLSSNNIELENEVNSITKSTILQQYSTELESKKQIHNCSV